MIVLRLFFGCFCDLRIVLLTNLKRRFAICVYVDDDVNSILEGISIWARKRCNSIYLAEFRIGMVILRTALTVKIRSRAVPKTFVSIEPLFHPFTSCVISAILSNYYTSAPPPSHSHLPPSDTAWTWWAAYCHPLHDVVKAASSHSLRAACLELRA